MKVSKNEEENAYRWFSRYGKGFGDSFQQSESKSIITEIIQ